MQSTIISSSSSNSLSISQFWNQCVRFWIGAKLGARGRIAQINQDQFNNVCKSLMKSLFLFTFLAFLLLVSGCSTVPEQQPKPQAKVVKPRQPAPPKKTQPKKPVPPPVAKKPAPSDTVTYPIDDGKSHVKVEPSVPAFRVDPLVPPVEVPSAQNSVQGSMLTPAMPSSEQTTTTPPTSSPPEPTIPAYTIEDVRMPADTSPAVVALVTEADRNRLSGNLDAAVVATERALRIDSRNPMLTYKLAQLRLKQNKPQLAEELAGKAALLAGSNLELKRKSWLLIAEARRMQQDYQGARQAQSKAESFFGH